MIAIIEHVRLIHDNLKPEDLEKFKHEFFLIINQLTLDENGSKHIEAINISFKYFKARVHKDKKTIHFKNINSDMLKIDENKPIITIPYV